MNPPIYFNHAAYCRTGGVGSRDAAFAACVDRTNRCNDVMRAIDLGGPLDAPEEIPAGSCESRLWVNWRGEPKPTTTTTPRCPK